MPLPLSLNALRCVVVLVAALAVLALPGSAAAAVTASAGGPYAIDEGGSLALDASGSTDGDGRTMSYSWDVNNDGTFGDAKDAKPTLTWAQVTALGVDDGPADRLVKVQVSAGGGTSTLDVSQSGACAVRASDKNVTCFGESSSTPAPGGQFTHVSLAVDDYRGGCGIRADQTVTCWGYNQYGERTAPTGTFKDVAAGNWHTCGIKTDGTLQCWGISDVRTTPVPAGTFKSVAVGLYTSCAVSTAGALVCWGGDWVGYNELSLPSGTFTSVSYHQNGGCAVRTDGSAACWGQAPTSVPAGPFTSIANGYNHACAVTTTGEMVCWGSNEWGQATARTGSFAAVAAGGYHTCGLRTSGAVDCWGNRGTAWAPVGLTAAISGAGESATAQAALTVSNVAPTALTLSDNGNNVSPDATYTLRAQATEPATPDRTDLEYVVDWGDGSAAQTVSGDEDVNLTHEYADEETDEDTYDISVTVDDADTGGGTGATDTHSVTVNPLPTVTTDATKSFAESTPWTLSATGSDPDGEDVTYTWDLDDDGTFGDATGATPTVSLEKLDELNLTDGPATRTIKVRAVDEAGGWAVASSTVTLTNAAPALTVTGPEDPGQYAKRNYTFTLDDAPEDEAGTSTFKIDWDGNGTVDETVTGASPKVVEHAYSTKGAATIKATAVDKNGAESAQATHALTVIKSLSADAGGPYEIDEGSPVALDGSGSTDLAGRTIGYAWDVDGDGQYDDATGDKPSLSWAQLSALGITDGPATRTVKVQTSAGGGGGATIDASVSNACAIKSDNTVACWGSDSSAPSGAFSQVSTNHGASCGIKTDGTMACWGSGDWGENAAQSGTFLSVGVGHAHSCAVRTTGALHCWGYSYDSRVTPPSGTFTSVAVGDAHACAVRSDGAVQCWNYETTAMSSVPTGTFKSVSASGDSTCGVKTDGTAVCWGTSGLGNYAAPAGPYSSVAAGWTHACGIKTDGTMACWGYQNPYGQMTAQAGSWSALTAGHQFSCGIRTNGSVLCWGYNGSGQTSVPVGLTASASGGGTGADTEVASAQLTVKNVAPTSLTLSDNGNNVAPDATYTLNAKMTDPSSVDQAGGVQYVVDWGDGSAVQTFTGDNDENLTHAYTARDTYTVKVTVKDEDGGEGPTKTKTVVVDAPPTVTTENATFAEGSAWSLAATGADAEGQTLTYEWDLDNDGAYDDETGATPELTFAELDALDFTDGPKSIPVKVKVTDPKNGFATASATITLTNVAPTATATGPADVVEHVSHDYTFTADDPSPEDEAGTFTYTIDWDGNGTVDETVTGGTTKVVKHEYTSPGSYTVKASAVDKNSGASTVVTHAVTATRSLTAAAAGPYSVDEGASLALDASGTTDLAGRTVSYAWDVDNDGQYDDATGAKPTLTWAQLSAIGVNDGPATKTVKVQASAGGTGGGATLSLQGYRSCVLKSDQTPACWGDYIYTPPAGSFAQISAGYYATCAIRSTDATLACWGASGGGETNPPSGAFLSVSVGQSFACGVRTTGALACWGDNGYGQQSSMPAGTNFTSVASGWGHSCALRTDGTVACWGYNGNGQTSAPGGTFRSLEGGWSGTCGVKTDGTATCWGYVGGASLSGQFASVATGENFACGLRSDGSVTCSGQSSNGQLNVPSGSYQQISAGITHACGVKTDGTVACWGYNGYGQNNVPFGLTAASGGSGGGADTEIATAELTVNNVAPTSLTLTDNANNVAPGATYTLRAQMVDPAAPDMASGVRYIVDWGDGEEQTISNVDADHDLTHVYDDLGDYEVSVTVFDKNDGEGPTKTHDITVNTPPTVSTAATYSFAEASPWQLETDSTDAEGNTVEFAWDLDNDGLYDEQDGGDPELTFEELDTLNFTDGPSTRPIKVKATDAKGGWAIASSTVTVTNVVPTATATGPASVNQHASHNYTFTADDPSPEDEAGTITYAIDWDGNGTTDETATGGVSKTVAHTYTTFGDITLKVTATDKNSGTSTAASHAVTVARSLTAVAGGPYSVTEGQPVTLDGSGTDLASRSIAYAWDLDGDTQYDDATGAKPTLTWAQLSALGINDGPASKTVKVQASAGGAAGATLDAMGHRSCGLKSDGTAACWGDTAAAVPSGTFSQISTGYSTTCAIRASDSGITCQGNQTSITNSVPSGQFSAVAVGNYHACALRTTGAIACWGTNSNNVLAGATGTNFTSVTSGADHSCALRTDGTVACWGYTSDGRGVSPSTTTTFRSIDAGWTGTCGIRTTGAVTCWGSPISSYSTAVTDFEQVTTGHDFGCGRRANGAVQCWGASTYGVQSVPAGPYRHISAGIYHMCGVKTDSTVVCWGYSGAINVPFGFTAAAGSGSTGDTHVSEATLNVVNAAPTALTLTDDGNNPAPGATYTLRAQMTDPAAPDMASGVKYEINWGDGATQTVTGDNDENLTHAYASLGTYEVSVKVLDKNDGEGPTKTKTVKVNTPPAVSSAATYAFDEGSAWALAATAPDAESDAVTYAWDLDNDGAYDDDTSATPEVTRAELIAFGSTFTDGPSSKTIKVKATDAAGGFSTATATVTIANAVPTLTITAPASITQRASGSYTFAVTDPSPQDEAGSFVYAIDWEGDGTFEETATTTKTATVSHTYATAGDFTIKAKATDKNSGVSEVVSKAITVKPVLAAKAGGPYSANEGSGVALDASATTDAEGRTVEYAWDLDADGQYDDATGSKPSLTAAQMSALSLADGPASRTVKVQTTAKSSGGGTLDAGAFNTCAVQSTGALRCWGRNDYSQSSPPSGNNYTQVAAGYYNACALKSDNTTACWGYPSYNINPATNGLKSVSVGNLTACGIRSSNNTVSCWGYTGYSQTTSVPTGAFEQVAVGDQHACALRTDGTVACWGGSNSGVTTPPAGVTFKSISAGQFVNCGVKTDGTAACWGASAGTPPAGVQFASVSAGGGHSCGLKSDGTIACWGSISGTPTTGTYTQLSSGYSHACAVRSDGVVVCWGNTSYSQTTVPTGTTVAPGGGGATETAVAEATLTIANVAPSTLTLTGDSSAVRGVEYTLNAEMDDASAADKASGVKYKVDWDGDDTVDETITGDSSEALKHTFTSGGTYTVKVTVEDKDSGVGPTKTQSVTVTVPFDAATLAARDVTQTAATLAGEFTPGGEATTYRFQYGKTTAYGSTTEDGEAGDGEDPVEKTAPITGLDENTTYHYRAVAVQGSEVVYGEDQTFTTTKTPPTADLSATVNGVNDVTFAGSVEPKGHATTYRIDWGATTDYGHSLSGDAGDGTSAFAVSRRVSGGATPATTFAPGETVHYRIVALRGTTEYPGDDETFVAAEAPDATTGTARDLTPTSATLVATLDGNGHGGEAFFRYGTTDAYGESTAPTAYGAGEGELTTAIGSLTPGTTYHVRVVVANTDGSVTGEDVTFTTPELPTAETNAASNVTETTATISGDVDAKGSAATYRFEYGTTDAYGTSTTAADAGSADGAVARTADLTGLEPGTTYHYRVVAVKGASVVEGDDATFTTPRTPVAVTGDATPTTAYTADLAGTVDPNSTATSYEFEYGTTDAYGDTTMLTAAGDGDDAVDAEATLSELDAATTYHYRLVAVRGSRRFAGDDKTFTTPAAPTVTTGAAQDVEPTSATLAGTFESPDSPARVAFDWGTEQPYGHLNAGETLHAAAEGEREATHRITGLTPGTTYHFRINAGHGAVDGADVTFTTPELPGAVTGTASAVHETTATLVGTTDANGSAAKYRFEYGTTDAYGTSTTLSDAGDSADPVERTLPLTGLAEGTTYHFRIVATKGGDVVYGDDQTFTTLTSPAVGAAEATSITHEGATLEGAVDDKGSATSYRFEYGTTDEYGSATTAAVVGDDDPAAAVTGLAPNTTYHFRLVALRGDREWRGGDHTFTTLKTPATATTGTAADVKLTTATLKGSIDPNGFATDYRFQYGTDTSYGTQTDAAEAGEGTDSVDKTAAITGLTDGTTYHFRIVAVRDGVVVATGDDATFTTPRRPAAVTGTATGRSTVRGTVDPNATATDYRFDWGTSDAYGNSTDDASAGDGDDPVERTAALEGLTEGTTYHFRIVALRDGEVVATGDDATFVAADVTDPTVALVTPANGQEVGRGVTVNASYTCTDDFALAETESCVGTVATGAAINTATLGEKTFSVTAKDAAGNTATETVTYKVVDVTQPNVSITTPAANAVLARGATVNAAYSCTDDAGGSGIATTGGCVGTVANGAALDTATAGPKQFVVTAKDAAGNERTVTRSYTVTDQTKPTITSSTDGRHLQKGEVATASFSCADDPGGSGIAATNGCVGTVANGSALNTATVGPKTFTVTARDAAGNTETKTVRYYVHLAVVPDAGCLTNTLARDDDNSSAAVPIGQAIKFYGPTFSTLYVNNNGNITFNAARTSYQGALYQVGSPTIAPFFSDVDTRNINSGQVTWGSTTFEGRQAFCANWTGVGFGGVGYYDQRADKLNTFQLLLVNREDTGTGNFDVVFNYDQILWDQPTYGGDSADVGMSNGTAAKTYLEAGSGTLGALLDSGSNGLTKRRRGSTQLGRLVVPVRNGEPGLPKIEEAAADSLRNEGQTLTASGRFSYPSPETPITLTADNTAGTFTDHGDGTWSWSLPTTDEVARKTINVKASDGLGSSITDSFDYEAKNVAPTLTIDGDATRTYGESSTTERVFDYTITDPGVNDTVASVTSSCGTGGTKVSDTRTGTSGTLRCTFADGPATPTVSLAATDNDGATGAADTVAVTVNNLVPAVTLSDEEGALPGDAITWDATLTDPSQPDEDGAVTWLADWNGDGTVDDTIVGTKTAALTHTFATSGSRTVKIAARDKDGGVSEIATDEVQVGTPPVAVPGGPYTIDEGSSLTLDGSGSSDAEGGALRYEWELDGDNDFNDAPDAASPTLNAAALQALGLHDGPKAFTVKLRVTDPTGLDHTASVDGDVDNVAPTLTFSDITRTVDEHKTEKRTFTYTIADPGDDTHTVEASCGENGVLADETLGSFKCVFKDGDAASTVSAKAKDSDNAVGATDTVAVTIRNAAPIVTFAGGDRGVDESGTDEHTFTFSVTDPGDDTIASVTTTCGTGGDKVSATNDSVRCRFLDGPKTPHVAATATDNNGASATGSVKVTVANVAPTLTAMTPPSVDVLVGQRYPWTFAGTDPSPVDQAQLKFVVDWGDGRTDTLPSPMTHPYGLPGDWTVTARASDKDGGLSAADSRSEYSGGMVVGPARSGVKKALHIGGTSDDDSFTVKRVSSTKVSVTTAGAPLRTFPLPASGEIVMSGSDGDDTLVVDDKVIQKTIAFGGDGHDTIKLANSDGIGVGGPGNDEILGDNGREMLYGGAGKDELDGKSRDDVLVAGRVAWERATYPDRLALTKLRNEWIRTNVPYATRVLRLRGAGGGRGSNGAMLLQNGPAGRTVFDDLSLDTLTGGTGDDWFMANTNAGNPVDSLPDNAAGETVSDLAGS